MKRKVQVGHKQMEVLHYYYYMFPFDSVSIQQFEFCTIAQKKASAEVPGFDLLFVDT